MVWERPCRVANCARHRLPTLQSVRRAEGRNQFTPTKINYLGEGTKQAVARFRAGGPIKLFTRLPRGAGAVQSSRLESADADKATVGIASLPYATFVRNISLARGRM